MQELPENIALQRESLKAFETAFKIVLKAGGLEFDVSERKKTNFNIEDSADYRENLTYVNEISFKLENSDDYVTQIITGADEIECFIFAYINSNAGKEAQLKIYGGTINRERSKEDKIVKDYELLVEPYFSKSERSALRLNTQYLDENGLKLHTAEIWLRDAAIEGYELSAGVHTIHTKTQDGYAYAKLNEGEWTALASTFTTVLESEEDSYGNTMKAEVYYYSFSWTGNEERSSTVIVKSQGEKYPYTYFYYPLVREVVQKAFAEMDIEDYKIDRFLIETFDGRKVVSGTSRIDAAQNNLFVPVAIVSDGADRIFISGNNNGFPSKNQIWIYNHVSGEVSLLFETTLNARTHYKLVWDRDENCLIAFIDNKETDEERGFIQKFVINELGSAYTTLLTDNQFDTVNPYYRFHYSVYLKLHIYLAVESGSKKIKSLSNEGIPAEILTDGSIEINGFNCLYDDGNGNVEFYYMKDSVSRAKKIYKIKYLGGEWQSPEYVADWFDGVNYQNFYGLQYLNEGKILILNYNRDDARFLNVAAKTFTGNLCPSGYKIYSPFEADGKMYFIKYKTADAEQKLSYFTSNAITDESRKVSPYDLVSTAGIFGFQHLAQFTDINEVNVIGVLSKNPSLLLKFADNIEPFIEGELDTDGKTIRDVLQELANNFLAYLKVDSNNKGWFVKRGSYSSGSALSFKKEYTAGRLKETVYNEKYDAVEIENANGFKKVFGDTGINAKRLSLNLNYIPDDFIMDAAKYFYDYYATKRNKYTISYLPGYFNYESLDEADLSSYGMGTGIIHKVKPAKSRTEFEVLVNAG